MTRDEQIEALKEAAGNLRVIWRPTLTEEGRAAYDTAQDRIDAVLAALHASPVGAERTFTTKELVEAIQHGIATARNEWRQGYAEPKSLVALVQEWQAAVAEYEGGQSVRSLLRLPDARAAVLAWTPAQAEPAAPDVAWWQDWIARRSDLEVAQRLAGLMNERQFYAAQCEALNRPENPAALPASAPVAPEDLLDLRDRVMAWKEAREHYKAAPTHDAQEFKRRQIAERQAQTNVLCWLPDHPAAAPVAPARPPQE